MKSRQNSSRSTVWDLIANAADGPRAPDMAKLVAEIKEATAKWEAMPLEEKLRMPVSHSTPGRFVPRVSDGPFAAWARVPLE